MKLSISDMQRDDIPKKCAMCKSSKIKHYLGLLNDETILVTICMDCSGTMLMSWSGPDARE